MITYCGRLSPDARKFFTAGIAALEKAGDPEIQRKKKYRKGNRSVPWIVIMP
jgi:hypothetical protein